MELSFPVHTSLIKGNQQLITTKRYLSLSSLKKLSVREYSACDDVPAEDHAQAPTDELGRGFLLRRLIGVLDICMGQAPGRQEEWHT